MKTTNKPVMSDEWQVTSGVTRAPRLCRFGPSLATRHSPLFRAFTLIELLVVISIIGVLAAFTIPVAHMVKRYQYISQTQAEMGKLESAIDGYKSTYSFYPPGNPNDPKVPPLYYELLGTTNNGVNYVTLDSSAIPIPVASVSTAFGVGGFVNCSKGSGEDATPAKNFLSGLKPQQYGTISNNLVAVTILLGSAGGPDQNDTYPFGATGMNPWRYVSPGVKNPDSYDLWMQLVIGGKTNLVCNWSKQVQFNQPLP
jgi:prepilin-type N-terminal cleavage/methylation domain-containing protein